MLGLTERIKTHIDYITNYQLTNEKGKCGCALNVKLVKCIAGH